MLISVKYGDIELFAEVKEGYVTVYRGPAITDINLDPQSCLSFMYQLVKTIKEQKEITSGEE